MKTPWILLLCSLLTSVSALAAEKPSIAQSILPKCEYAQVSGVEWQMAVCPMGEKKSHYATEIRFKKKGQVFFKYLHLDNPTGGNPSGDLLKAGPRFAVIQLSGDETNQVVIVDLKLKKVALNTGNVVGLAPCQVSEFSESEFCSVAFTCPIGPKDKGSKADFHEFLCP